MQGYLCPPLRECHSFAWRPRRSIDICPGELFCRPARRMYRLEEASDFKMNKDVVKCEGIFVSNENGATVSDNPRRKQAWWAASLRSKPTHRRLTLPVGVKGNSPATGSNTAGSCAAVISVVIWCFISANPSVVSGAPSSTKKPKSRPRSGSLVAIAAATMSCFGPSLDILLVAILPG